MTELENKADILRRIEKLLAIAQDDRANPNEASAAAAMAERIMRKYEIDHKELILESLRKGDDMTSETVLATALRPHEIVRSVPVWAQWMAVRIAELMDVQAESVYKRPHQVIRFRGFGSDVKIAAWQYAYLVATVNRLCTAFKSTPAYTQATSQKVMNSYRSGVALGICSNLRAAQNAREAENKKLDAAGNASAGSLIVLAKAQAVQQHFGEITYSKTTTTTAAGSAYQQGHRDGKAVDVNRRALDNATQPKLIGN